MRADGDAIKLLLRNVEVSLSSRGLASHSYAAPVRSMLLGVANGDGCPSVSAAAMRLPGVTACINQYMRECIDQSQVPEAFTWTSLQLNRFRADIHCDVGNEPDSSSVAVAFGDYEGGALCIFPRGTAVAEAHAGRARMVVAADINDKPLTFDPFAPHAPARWAGDRCSIVFFTARDRQKAGPAVFDTLRSMGFAMQTASSVVAGSNAMQDRCNVAHGPAPPDQIAARPVYQSRQDSTEGGRTVRITFHLHGDGCRSDRVPTDEAFCTGALFQSVLGAAISPGTWRNLRFRVGGISLTAEATLAAAENTDVIVGSVLRGGGRGSAKGNANGRYDGGGGGPSGSHGYAPMQDSKGKGYGPGLGPHQSKGALAGTQSEMQAALQLLMSMIEQAKHAPSERQQSGAAASWGAGEWQAERLEHEHRRHGWAATAQDLTGSTAAREVPWGGSQWSERAWEAAPWPEPEYAETAGPWEATAAGAAWEEAEAESGVRNAHGWDAGYKAGTAGERQPTWQASRSAEPLVGVGPLVRGEDGQRWCEASGPQADASGCGRYKPSRTNDLRNGLPTQLPALPESSCSAAARK